MYSVRDDTELPVPGCPIRKSPDQRLLDSSPRPIAASHVLHRLLAPRHPPCALSSLTSIRRHYQVHLHKPDTHMQLSKTNKKKLSSFRSALTQSGADRDRTDDLRLAKAALSQLSY